MTMPEGEGWNQIDLSKTNSQGVTYDSEAKSLSVKGVENFYVPLGDNVSISTGKKVELFIRGNDIGGSLFRVWLDGGGGRNTEVATYTDSAHWSGRYNSSGEGGAFEVSCSLTTGTGDNKDPLADSTDVCFKKTNAWDGTSITKTDKIDNIVITTLWYRIVEE